MYRTSAYTLPIDLQHAIGAQKKIANALPHVRHL